MLAWKDDKDGEGRKGTRVGDRKQGKKRMMIIINRELCCAFRETQESSHAASITQLCQLAQQSSETPKLLKGHRKQTVGGTWVAAQKPHNSIWQGKPACWWRPGVQPQLPGPPSLQQR